MRRMTSTGLPTVHPLPGNTGNARRLKSLDGLRGVAAFAVMFIHMILFSLPDNSAIPTFPTTISYIIEILILFTPLGLLVNGHSAVLVFFVISGVALSLSANAGNLSFYRSFLISRVSRIWPPFAAALCIAAFLSFLVPPGPSPFANAELTRFWKIPPTADVFIEQILMTGRFDTLDWPVWSLIVEMRISLLFPLLVWCCIRAPRTTMAASGALSIAFVMSTSYVRMTDWSFTSARAAGYVFLFTAGILIARNLDHIRVHLARLTRSQNVLCWCFVLALVGIRTSRLWPGMTLDDGIRFYMCATGAILLVLLIAAGGRISRLMEHPVPQGAGRISYSLYLLHMPVIGFCLKRIAPLTTHNTALLIGFVISIAAAILARRWIEIPSVSLGKYLVRRFGNTSGRPAISPLSGCTMAEPASTSHL
ncbi:acyltransferase [Acetobacter oeni]|uniref:Acyltransferase n=2 Tax=Acetobacter oeni TaxID=304077 RepID=A0A511XHV7_9PROT|nr:acyltransferase [Acetobacter oeni]